MIMQRTRFLSEQSPIRPIEFLFEDDTPPSPIIHNLELDVNEELDDLEIAPSDDFESQKEAISVYLSSTNDELKVDDRPPKAFANTLLNIELVSHKKPRRRVLSHCIHNNKHLIYDALCHKF